MATSLRQEGTTHNNNTTRHHDPTNSPGPYFVINLSRIRIGIPKAMSGGGASDGNGKGGSMMVGLFRKKKCEFQDERSPFNAIQSSKPHSALSVPRNMFPVQGVGQMFASKARLFRKFTWVKLPKKPVFRPPNLFRKDPVMKLLKDVVVPTRGIQRIRGVSARKSICKQETRMDDCIDNDRKDGGLELCKKRILLGYKCRPLGSSGTLRYDQNGILLPELFP